MDNNTHSENHGGLECKDGVCSLPPMKEEKPKVACDGDTCRLVAPEESTTEAPVVNLEDLL